MLIFFLPRCCATPAPYGVKKAKTRKMDANILSFVWQSLRLVHNLVIQDSKMAALSVLSHMGNWSCLDKIILLSYDSLSSRISISADKVRENSNSTSASSSLPYTTYLVEITVMTVINFKFFGSNWVKTFSTYNLG